MFFCIELNNHERTIVLQQILFFENETYIAKQSRGYKRKPAKQEREAYQFVHKDLKKGG